MAQWLRLGLPVQETQEMWVQSLGGKDPLEKEITAYSSILRASLIAQLVKNPPAIQETLV